MSQMSSIPFDVILQHPAKLTPISVRTYLKTVVEKLNQYFGFICDGPNICKLCLTRNNVDNIVTVAQARHLFPYKVNIRWIESKKQKIFFKNVVDIFVQSSNRREIYHDRPFIKIDSPVKLWLKYQLSLESCLLKWDGLNARSLVYSTFLDHVSNANDYTPKKISQEIYKCMPICRPTTRVRSCGVSMIYLPSISYCQQVVEH